MSTRCVFLDRDGIINNKPAAGEYVRDPEEFRLIPTVADWIKLANALGFLVIVVTNQRGVALGRMTESDLRAIHEKMTEDLGRLGARIDDIFYCPHALDSCVCRKPKPGLIYAAQDKWNIDLAQSLLIGDSESDHLLASSCGLRFLLAADGRLI